MVWVSVLAINLNETGLIDFVKITILISIHEVTCEEFFGLLVSVHDWAVVEHALVFVGLVFGLL